MIEESGLPSVVFHSFCHHNIKIEPSGRIFIRDRAKMLLLKCHKIFADIFISILKIFRRVICSVCGLLIISYA